MCILSVFCYFVGYYDLSVLSKSEMGFQKNPSFFWIFGIFLTLQSPLGRPCHISLFFLPVEDLTLCNVVLVCYVQCQERKGRGRWY